MSLENRNFSCVNLTDSAPRRNTEECHCKNKEKRKNTRLKN